MDWNGTFKASFPFAPESTKNRGRFRKAVHEVLREEDFWLSGEVHVLWVLFLDEEQRRRTDRYADCDNYVKTLNDAIKGPGGVLIDDTQIQALHVSWVDTPGSEYFELTIEGRPDEAMRGVTGLYEMSDGLFYPANQHAHSFVPAFDQVLRGSKKVVSRIGSEVNLSRAQKWDLRKRTSPGMFGYHKSRIIDSGFPIHSVEEWRLTFAEDIRRLREWTTSQGHAWHGYETPRPAAGQARGVDSESQGFDEKEAAPRPRTAQEPMATDSNG